MTEPSQPIFSKPHRSPEWFLAVALTLAVILLHGYFLTRVGGLWRDEVNSLSIAQGGWAMLGQDSFPFLFPTWLRTWCALGLGASDGGLRLFGALTGLSLTAAFWISAWWLRRRPPLWSLVLVALNSWVIIYDSSLRAYGLGSSMIVLCCGAAWLFLEQPGRRTWCFFAATAILSVQTLYQNTALVAAICAGAGAVALRQKKHRLTGAIFLGGLVAAISLLPYASAVWEITHSTVLVRKDFDGRNAFTCLCLLLEFPLRSFFWVWLGLAGLVLVRAMTTFFSARSDDRALFSLVNIGFGVFALMVFLRLAEFFVQPWYFLPLLAMSAVTLENVLPRLEGKFRAGLWGGVLAIALVATCFSLRLLEFRFTNLDLMAKKINVSASKNDFTIVKNWTFGITFGRYFHGPGTWNTIPPIADHSRHRYDLLAAQLPNPNTLDPVFLQARNTLRAGGNIWLVGVVLPAADTNDAASWSARNWNEMMGYALNRQLDEFLWEHCREINCLDPGTNEMISDNECSALFQAAGWKD